MRILIPHAYNVKGGVEKTAVSLIREFAELVDRVMFILPDSQIPYFQNLLPPSGKLVYEPLAWPGDLMSKVKKRIFRDRLRYLTREHRATHCLYMIINGQQVPDIPIPVAGILYDVYWHGLNNVPEALVKARDNDLNEWLQKADLLFTISKATKRDAAKLFPQYESKMKAVPLACTAPQRSPARNKDRMDISAECVFYYPSAHSSYQKNHQAIFEAAVKLAEKGLEFKIIISGVGTETLAGEQPLKDARVEPTRLFYQRHKDTLSGCVKIMGDCTPEQIEGLYGSASCVVLPSTYEGFGLPLSEAVSRGIPVICSGLDVFKEQAALYSCADRVQLFPAGNSDALTECMEEFIRQPKSRIPPETVREKLSHWTWRDVAKAYVESMEKMRGSRFQAPGIEK